VCFLKQGIARNEKLVQKYCKETKIQDFEMVECLLETAVDKIQLNEKEQMKLTVNLEKVSEIVLEKQKKTRRFSSHYKRS